MLKDRNNVRKPFVKCRHIPIARLNEIVAQSIYNRMRHLVGDDVVR